MSLPPFPSQEYTELSFEEYPRAKGKGTFYKYDYWPLQLGKFESNSRGQEIIYLFNAKMLISSCSNFSSNIIGTVCEELFKKPAIVLSELIIDISNYYQWQIIKIVTLQDFLMINAIFMSLERRKNEDFFFKISITS